MANVQNDGHNRFRREVQSTVNQAQARLVYGVTYIVLLAQLIISIVVSVVTWNATCDAKLQLWLVGHIVRTAIFLPITRYEQIYFARQDYDLSHRCFRTFKMLFEIAALLWFVLGNSYVFGSQTCQSTAPLLYGTCFAWMITGYIGLGLPLLFCLALVFCFPCVYIVLQHFSEVVDPPPPDVEKRINAIPVVKFVPSMFPDPEDAKCIICLEDYQSGIELRMLPCKHHFHKACADGWFKMKPHCPLCQAELDGSRPPDESHNQHNQPNQFHVVDVAMVQPVNANADRAPSEGPLHAPGPIIEAFQHISVGGGSHINPL